MSVEGRDNPFEDKYATLTGRNSTHDVGLTYADIFQAGYAQNKAIEFLLRDLQKGNKVPLSVETKQKITETFLQKLEKEGLFSFQDTRPAEEKGKILKGLIQECLPILRKMQDEAGVESLKQQEAGFGEISRAQSFKDVVVHGLGIKLAVDLALRDLDQLEYITLDASEQEAASATLKERMAHLFTNPTENSTLPPEAQEKIIEELARITHEVAELYQNKVRPHDAENGQVEEDDFDFSDLDKDFAAFETPPPAAPEPQMFENPAQVTQPSPEAKGSKKESDFAG